MHSTIYATFETEADAKRASDALREHGIASHGIHAAPISDPTIPQPPRLPTLPPRNALAPKPDEIQDVDFEHYHFDAIGAVLPDRKTGSHDATTVDVTANTAQPTESHTAQCRASLAVELPGDASEASVREILSKYNAFEIVHG